MLERSRSSYLPYGCAFGVVLFLYWQMSIGHLFNEDYAVYLQQAFNIAHQLPLSEMGVVYHVDPTLELLYQGPLTYPPLLPLIYAIPVSAEGYNFEHIKAIQLGQLLIGLLFFAYAMRNWGFSTLEITTSILMFGLSFEIRRSVNSIGSDLPFILFIVLALYLADRFIASAHRENLTLGVVCGFSIFLAIDMRTVGVATIPTLVCADLIKHRRIRLAVFVPVAAAAGFWLGQRLVIGDSGSYGYLFNYRFFTPSENLKQFYWALVSPIERTGGGIAKTIFLLLSGLAFVGVLKGAFEGRVLPLFAVVYTSVLLVLPNFDAGARYLVPDILMLGAFACRGASIIANRLTSWTERSELFPIGVAVVGICLFSFVPRPLPAGLLDFGVEAPSAQEVFTAVGDLPPTSLLAATKYRGFHLATMRRTIRLPATTSADALLQWFSSNHVDYVVIKTSPPAWNYDFTDCPVNPLCDGTKARHDVIEIFRNRDYALFKIERPAS